ncbi:MAG: hypothetical protein AAF399_19080 [Bacteroidota bacterium]
MMGFFCFFLCPERTQRLYRLLLLGFCLSGGLGEVMSQDQFRKITLSWKQKAGNSQLQKLRLYETHTGELSFLSRFPASTNRKAWHIQAEPWGQVAFVHEADAPTIDAYLGQHRLEGFLLGDSLAHQWQLTIPGDTFQLAPSAAEQDSFFFSLDRIYPLPNPDTPSGTSNVAVPLMQISGIRERPRTLRITYLQVDAQISNLVQMVAMILAVQSLSPP